MMKKTVENSQVKVVPKIGKFEKNKFGGFKPIKMV
jgi:hypothetical protein